VWGLSAAALQAISSWSLAVAGAAGVIAVLAGLVSAVASAKLAELTRARAETEVVQARLGADAARARSEADALEVRAAQARTADLASANFRLEQALERAAPPAGETGPGAFARRAEAFAALIRGRTAELALVVGHGPDAHAAGQMLRQVLKAAGVPVRWCRLKPSAEADHAAADALTVYADPARPEASALVEALTRAGFSVEVAPFRRAEPGLPSPAIVFAASRKPPAAAALSLCNPVLGAPLASRD
jgi:broad specificity phosphatase PhoE